MDVHAGRKPNRNADFQHQRRWRGRSLPKDRSSSFVRVLFRWATPSYNSKQRAPLPGFAFTKRSKRSSHPQRQSSGRPSGKRGVPSFITTLDWFTLIPAGPSAMIIFGTSSSPVQVRPAAPYHIVVAAHRITAAGHKIYLFRAVIFCSSACTFSEKASPYGAYSFCATIWRTCCRIFSFPPSHCRRTFRQGRVHTDHLPK